MEQVSAGPIPFLSPNTVKALIAPNSLLLSLIFKRQHLCASPTILVNISPVDTLCLLSSINSILHVSVLTRNSSGDEIANVNFFYDMVHVQASAYAHWTNFLISTIHLRYLCTYLPIKPSSNVDSPVQPAVLYKYKKLIRRHGRRQLQSEVETTASSFCQNNRWIIVQIVLIWSQNIKSRLWSRGRPNNCFTTSYTKIWWNNAK